MNVFKLFRKNKLFANLDDKEINAIFDCLKGRIVKPVRGKVLCKEGDPVEEIGIIREGTCLKFITKSNGEREAREVLTAGDMFGEVEGYIGDKTMMYSVVASDDVTVLYITLSTIVKQCSKTCPVHQKVLENMLALLAERVSTLNKDTEYLIVKSMRQKIAKFVYEKYLEQNSLEIDLGMDRNEMAQYLNVSRPSMSREMLKMMNEDGIFKFRKAKLTILKLDEIEKIVNAIKI